MVYIRRIMIIIEHKHTHGQVGNILSQGGFAFGAPGEAKIDKVTVISAGDHCLIAVSRSGGAAALGDGGAVVYHRNREAVGLAGRQGCIVIQPDVEGSDVIV